MAERKTRVLVVDDEPIVRDALPKLLGARGFAVEAAADPAGALRTARTFHPDVLVVDYMLHDAVDGLQVARTLQDGNPALRVVVMSGYASAGLEVRIGVLRHAGFLWKPFDTEALVALIRSLAPPPAPADADA